MEKMRLLVAREGKVIGSGYAAIFDAQPGFEVIGQAEHAVLEEAASLQPDAILYEMKEPLPEAAGLITTLKEACPCSKVVVISEKVHSHDDLKMLIKHIDGYLANSILVGNLVKAMELVCCSGMVCLIGSLSQIKPSVTTRNDESDRTEYEAGMHGLMPVDNGGYHAATVSAAEISEVLELTCRENEVYHLMLIGSSNKDIASQLYISEPTVKTHVSNILRKMGVGSRHELMLAMMAGLSRENVDYIMQS